MATPAAQRINHLRKITMTNEWQEKLKKFQEARKEKSAWYEKTGREILEKHQITACYKCDCRGWGRETKHSRAHAHTKKRIVCLDAVPKGYKSFFTLLHEIGHIVAEKADYSSEVPRSLAEHNATEWAYKTLKELGLPIKRKVKGEYDSYIKEKVARGLRRGLREIPKELRKHFKS